jgi:hypothetical protein
MQYAAARQRYQSGANWFYWIAGLTLITSMISLLGGGWRFFLSLEITQVIDGISLYAADRFGEAAKVIAIVLDIFIAALFAGIAYLANKRQLWAYVVGMVLFLFDSLLSILIFDWLAIIVHGFVLVMLIRGFIAGRELLTLERAMTEAAVSAQANAQATAEPAAASTF